MPASARTITRPYALPSQLSYDEAQEIAARIIADSYTGVPRDDQEAFASWVQMLDRDALEDIETNRQALAATYQRLDEARKEIHGLRNTAQVEVLARAKAERLVATRDAEIVAVRRVLADTVADLVSTAKRADRAERALAAVDDTVVVDLELVGAA